MIKYPEDLAMNFILLVCSRYFTLLKIIFCFVIPIAIPPLLWNEKWQYSALGMGVVRYVLGLNFTWLVNSAAHIWGKKPYDR
jgi:stearoyl-CoA desaturase (delta-9 desaturase)